MIIEIDEEFFDGAPDETLTLTRPDGSTVEYRRCDDE
jgi:hypothetical protein